MDSVFCSWSKFTYKTPLTFIDLIMCLWHFNSVQDYLLFYSRYSTYKTPHNIMFLEVCSYMFYLKEYCLNEDMIGVLKYTLALYCKSIFGFVY